MTKSARKKAKKATPAKKAKRPAKSQAKAVEYVSNLLQLHKLQGVLLTRLKKEVS